ncbi:MAG: hypothetical protein KZQ84_17960 [Candidatus Thiodiazotropha sp. (ex Lucinoma borealis)]|nr:hypothetical protein [Candidatus Thiodiazotropha sp. (ex Lucinoma borealis)]
MRNRSHRPRIPVQNKKDYHELDSVDTESTDGITRKSHTSNISQGNVSDVGPALHSLDDSSPITYGQARGFTKIMAIVIAIVTAIGGAIWWAASIQGDVDTLVDDVDAIEISTRTLEKNYVRQDERLQYINKEISNLQLSTSQKKK